MEMFQKTNAQLCCSSNGETGVVKLNTSFSQNAPHLHHHNALLGEACCDLPRWSDIVALSSAKGLLHDWISAENPWQECGGVAPILFLPWLTNCCRRAEGWFRISWKHCVGLQSWKRQMNGAELVSVEMSPSRRTDVVGSDRNQGAFSLDSLTD